MKYAVLALIVCLASVGAIEEAFHSDEWCHNHHIGEGAESCVKHSGCAFDAKTDSCHSENIHSDAWCSAHGNDGVKECIQFAGCYFDDDFDDNGIQDEDEWDQDRWDGVLLAEANRVEPNYDIEGADTMKRKELFSQRLLDIVGGDNWYKVKIEKSGDTYSATVDGEEVSNFMNIFQTERDWDGLLMKYDENEDGRISKGEFPDETEFNLLDLNADGFIDAKVKYLCLSTGDEAQDEQSCSELASAGGSHLYDTGNTGVKCETDLDCMESEPTDAKGNPCYDNTGRLLTAEQCKAEPQCFNIDGEKGDMGSCARHDRMIPQVGFSGVCFGESGEQAFCDRGGTVRNFIPMCTETGEFEAYQLDDTSGFMFCVDENGHDIPDTRKQVKYLTKRDADGNRILMEGFKAALAKADKEGKPLDLNDLEFEANCVKKRRQHGNWQCPNAMSLTLFGGDLQASEHPDVGNCDVNCNTDADCKTDGEWCCFNGCGASCQAPILPQADCEHLPEDDSLSFTLVTGAAERNAFDLKHGLEQESKGKLTAHGSIVRVSCGVGFSGSKPKEITCTHGIWDDWSMDCYSDCPRFKIRQTDQEWSNNGQGRANLNEMRESAMRKSGGTTALKFLNDEDGEEGVHFYDRERNYVVDGFGVNHGDQLVLSCAPGYGPVSGLPMVMQTGKETLECVNGVWQATEANVNDPPIPMRTLVCDVCFDKFSKGPKEHTWVDDQGRGCDFYAQRASYCIDNQPAMDNCRVACRTCEAAEAKHKVWARALSMTKVINSFTMEKVFNEGGLTDESTIGDLMNAIANQMELKSDAQGIVSLTYQGQDVDLSDRLATIEDVIGEVANVLDLQGFAERHPEHWHRKQFRNFVAFQPTLVRQERSRVWRVNYQVEKPKKKKVAEPAPSH